MPIRAGSEASFKQSLREIIFEADTPAGKTFDVALLVAIVASVAAVLVESVPSLPPEMRPRLVVVEWIFTALFTLEYISRLYCSPKPMRYTTSFFGVVDLLSILPSYLSLLFPGSQSLIVIRSLRLLRVFRVLKLGHFLGEANILLIAIRAGTRKVLVFLGTVVILIVIVGTSMYLIEGPENGFSSIPRSMYWAVVTMTTVGYGNLVPSTQFGQLLASAVMILGYSIIAIPTGIMTAEMIQTVARPTTRVCHECMSEGHALDARFCKDCGESLEPRSD
jgi:voltage-gated potassium channel